MFRRTAFLIVFLIGAALCGPLQGQSIPDTLWLGNNGLTADNPVENRSKSGSLLRSFQAPALGIAIDPIGNRLFVSSARNPIRIYDLITLSQIGSINQLPTLLTGSDLSFDGSFLYRADPSSTAVYKINPISGESSPFLVGLANPIGLAWDGHQHFIVEAGGGPLGIPRLSRYSSDGVRLGESPLSGFNSGAVAGLAYDTSDGTLWLGSQSRVYHLSTDAVVLGSFDFDDVRIAHGLEYQGGAPVPEPSSFVFAIAGLAILWALRRRFHR